MAFTERSAATRTSILEAARKLLIERGYEAMTIRAVAAQVGVDPSMVMRYYGSKAGLFSAAVDVDLRLAQVPEPPVDRLGELLVRHFLARWEGGLSDDVLILLLRSASTNPMAAERMREVFQTQIVAFVARVTGADDAARRAGLVSTQLLGLALTRYVLQLPPMAAADPESLVRDLGPAVQRYLTD
ncbi:MULTISPECIES: TetR/AcrR family transcriptional regulator [unclassified Nonomuraea]|uniref:TetR/AcrR family transcriptional regulator n=1 Tax=unclassified Nonomuraea TaxID=2593643 RepID=UPI00273AA343|nr:TetR family transcriptional regulator [Nonomuraea sp. G32]MDP4503326.1 TetR family transcriptional regulator [Nonomuraea sp. G32]